MNEFTLQEFTKQFFDLKLNRILDFCDKIGYSFKKTLKIEKYNILKKCFKIVMYKNLLHRSNTMVQLLLVLSRFKYVEFFPFFKKLPNTRSMLV